MLNSSSFKQFLSENEVHPLPLCLLCVITVLDCLVQTACNKLLYCVLIGMVETICGILLFAGLFRDIWSQPMGSVFSVFQGKGIETIILHWFLDLFRYYSLLITDHLIDILSFGLILCECACVTWALRWFPSVTCFSLRSLFLKVLCTMTLSVFITMFSTIYICK